jgi:hypothetical protein
LVGASAQILRTLRNGEWRELRSLEGAGWHWRGIRRGRVVCSVRRERVVPIVYKQKQLKKTYKLDLVIENLVVVEVKSVAALLPVHEAQVITYLKLTGVSRRASHQLQRPEVDAGGEAIGPSRRTTQASRAWPRAY